MENLRFYPYLSKDLLDKAGCSTGEYEFSYCNNNGLKISLERDGRNSSNFKLKDLLEIWKLDEDGVTIEKKVSIAYPNLLFGEDGVACEDAEIGICLIWTNNRLTQTGYILPASEISRPTGREYIFTHTFGPGTIAGSLDLSVNFYIKSAADIVKENELHLMNEEGVSVGEIDRITVDFDSMNMEFPIQEVTSKTEPLWWIELSQWEDPKTVEEFTEDNICIYLNTYYSACPVTDGKIKNIDMLIDILSTSYMMIFQKLDEEDLRATKDNVGLEPNTICSILHQFVESCNAAELRFESPEALLRTLQINIRAMLTEDAGL